MRQRRLSHCFLLAHGISAAGRRLKPPNPSACPVLSVRKGKVILPSRILRMLMMIVFPGIDCKIYLICPALSQRRVADGGVARANIAAFIKFVAIQAFLVKKFGIPDFKALPSARRWETYAKLSGSRSPECSILRSQLAGCFMAFAQFFWRTACCIWSFFRRQVANSGRSGTNPTTLICYGIIRAFCRLGTQ